MAINWLYNVLKRGHTDQEADTLGIEGVDYVDAGAAKIIAGSIDLDNIEATGDIEAGGDIKATGDIEAGGDIKATDDIEAGGDIKAGGHILLAGVQVDRLYRYESAEINLTGTGATAGGPIFPVAGQVLRAYAVVTTSLAAVDVTTAAISIRYNGSDDAIVDGFAPEKADPAGTVYELPIEDGDPDPDGFVPAGNAITISHVQQADIEGKVKVVIEYVYVDDNGGG